MENYHEIDLKEVGERIRSARKILGLSQDEAAHRAYITNQFGSRLELGHERASVNTYRQIAAVLELTLDDIFYDDATSIRLHKAFSKEGIIAECTVFEKAVISEMIFALKGILERNRSV